MQRAKPKAKAKAKLLSEAILELKMYLVPCSCGITFAVSPTYDGRGTAVSRYMPCPNCGKRHDPKNRLLQMGYQREKYWKVDDC